MIERGDPLSRFFTQASDVSICKFFWFLAVRSFTAAATDGRCEHLTRHIFSLIHTHMRGSRLKLRVCRAHIMCHPHVFVLTLFEYSTFLSLLTIFSLITLSFFLPINFIFHDVVDKFPVHSLMRILATLPSTTLSQKEHRTKKEMQRLSLFEKFIAEGNEKADGPANEGTMLDGGFMSQVRAITVQREREVVYAALQHAASFHCLVEEWEDCGELRSKPKEKLFFVTKKEEAKKH